ncbi:MAG TPA: hypothetical protein VJY39_07405, partial [Acidisphaera sp.]|nr:hypothetical protein [Acidisphaera sp.]
LTRSAAKALRKQAISRPEVIIGRVERLQSEDDPSDLLNPGAREIYVHWLSEDLGTLSVRVSLPAHDYLAAIEAHKTGRPVKVSGTDLHEEHAGRRRAHHADVQRPAGRQGMR